MCFHLRSLREGEAKGLRMMLIFIIVIVGLIFDFGINWVSHKSVDNVANVDTNKVTPTNDIEVDIILEIDTKNKGDVAIQSLLVISKTCLFVFLSTIFR